MTDADAAVMLDELEWRGELPEVWDGEPPTPVKRALLARGLGWDGPPRAGEEVWDGGWGSGTGDGDGYGDGDGSGYGYGYGSGHGGGYGVGWDSGAGHGTGVGYGVGSGSGRESDGRVVAAVRARPARSR